MIQGSPKVMLDSLQNKNIFNSSIVFTLKHCHDFPCPNVEDTLVISGKNQSLNLLLICPIELILDVTLWDWDLYSDFWVSPHQKCLNKNVKRWICSYLKIITIIHILWITLSKKLNKLEKTTMTILEYMELRTQ